MKLRTLIVMMIVSLVIAGTSFGRGLMSGGNSGQAGSITTRSAIGTTDTASTTTTDNSSSTTTDTKSADKGMCPMGKGEHPDKPMIDILSGEAVIIIGTVSEVGNHDALKINNGTEVIAVEGIGPAEYWESLGIARPAVGDTVTVDGYKVTMPDSSQKIFAAKVTIGDKQVTLIDTTTGRPLWHPKGGHGHAPVDILSGEAVTILGTVSEVADRDGLKINTGTELITVYGIGSAPYWESLGIVRPAVGDTVTVDGYKVTMPDSSQEIFAATITIGENQIQLIDTTTGRPLWMKDMKKPASAL